jgi:STE24 endopeptidase
VSGETTPFAPEEVDRARRYHRPIYVSLLAETVLAIAVLAALSAWSPDPGWSWPLATAGLAVLAGVAAWLVRLPLAYRRGLVHERAWGLSTQTSRPWVADRVKALLIGLFLTSWALIALVGFARAFPTWWPVPAALGAMLLVLLLGFVAPVILEPIFNRFEPLREEPLATELRGLAGRAGVPVAHVLVSDASRRTTKVNAYVSGLGRTRRVVLWDTLLRRSGPREVRLVVAHELGHRRLGHVAKLTALAMAGSAVLVGALWLLLRDEVADPASVPRILLLGAVLELLALPPSNWLSRRFEREADAFSLELTGDREAFVRAHRSLALENLADLDPPSLAYLLLFTHPTPVERLRQADA